LNNVMFSIVMGAMAVVPVSNAYAVPVWLSPTSDTAVSTTTTATDSMTSLVASPRPAESQLTQPYAQLPDVSTPTEATLQQRLQDLELRQQSLEQEIEVLRQQIEQQAVESADVDTTTAATEAANSDLQGVSFSAEAIIFRPRTSILQDYAIVDPGQALFTGGDVAAPDYDQRVGARFKLRYHIPNSPVTVGATYTTLDSSGSSAVERPVNGFLLATLAAPVQNENADRASSSLTLTYDVTDVEVAYHLPGAGSLHTQLFGGVRFANINQANNVFYDGQDFTNGTVNIRRSLSGVGFRVGGEVALDLGSDISLFGRAAGSLLISDISTRQQETNNNGSDLIVSLNRTASDRVIPVMELVAGLQWQPQLNENLSFDVAAGYEFQQWFNASDTARFVDNSGTGVITQDTGDLSLSGFFLRLGLLFRF
jgi:cell division protein FtsB